MYEPDLDTVFSDDHRVMVEWLEQHEIRLMIEVPFPPYMVDVYFPYIHAALEVDGPFHTRRGDEKRDTYLDVTYYLPVFHVKSDVVRSPEKWRYELVNFFTDWAPSYEERWAKCEDRTPWL